MKKRGILNLFVALLFIGGIDAQAQLTDPYEIMTRHYEATGGLDRYRAQKTSYSEGKIILEGTGLEGTYAQWNSYPIKNRQEVDLKVISQLSGDNGEYRWSVDHNGKVQINRDEKTIGERRVETLMAEFDHLNRESDNFELLFQGIEKIGQTDCYGVKLTNNINNDITIQYFDTASFYLLKNVHITPDSETRSLFSDFRETDGFINAFRQEMEILPIGMKQTIEISRIEINPEIDEALFEPPTEDVEDFAFANGKSAENIPFQFLEDHIYLKVTIAGQPRLWVLDTGAGATVIDKTYAAELGLQTEGEMTGRGAGNLVAYSWVTMPAFEFPGLKFNEQKVVTMDIAPLFRKSLGLEVVGILGYDFLSRLVTRVDFANESLSFYHPDSFAYHGPGTVIEAPVTQGNMFHVPATVDGQYSGLWNLDLGANGLNFQYPFSAAHNFSQRPGIDHIGAGAGGFMKEKTCQFDSISFAGFTVDKPLISISLEEGPGAFSSGDLIGNLGNELFRRFVMYLDYKREQVIVEKGDNFERVFPRDNSGLAVWFDDEGQMSVLFVPPGTPAEKAGFVAGDIVTAINDIEVEYLDGPIAVRKLLKKKPGTKLTFNVIRDGQEKTLKMTLRDLYD